MFNLIFLRTQVTHLWCHKHFLIFILETKLEMHLLNRFLLKNSNMVCLLV